MPAAQPSQPSTVPSLAAQPASKSSKAKRKAQERQQTQSVDGKLGTGNSLASQKPPPSMGVATSASSNKPVSRDNSAVDVAGLQRLGQRNKNQTSTSQLSNKSSPFKVGSAHQSGTTNSKLGNNTALSSAGRSDTASQQTEGSASQQRGLANRL